MIPRYVKIRDSIIKRIEAGELKPGDQIPSLREMCLEHSVSSITARRALLDLLNDGIVERRGGLGAFVTGAVRRAQIAVVIIGYTETSWRRDSGSFGQLVGGIASAAWEEAATLSVVPINDTARAAASLDRLLRDQPIDGVLFRIAGEVDWAILDVPRSYGVEAVLIKRMAPSHSTPCVVPDAVRAGRLSVQHLAGAGHRRIGLVATTVSPDTYRDHRAGFVQAMQEAGLPLLPELMCSLPGRGTREDGFAMARQLLDLAERPTAIVTNSDFLAAGVYEAVAAAGLSIPDDLSVVSFDDVEFAAHLSPPLTTVRLSYYDLGHAAAVALFHAIRGHKGPGIDVVPVELVERGSVAPIP